MIELLFSILMLYALGKMLFFAIRCTWNFAMVFLCIIFLPLILIVMVLAGFIYLAFPILVIVGIVCFLKKV